MEYHVLSNNDMELILAFGIVSGVVLCLIFRWLAIRDAATDKTRRGIIKTIVSWMLLVISISQVALLVYQYINYPWESEPFPSQGSIYREISYLGSNYPLFGWANDDQLSIISTLAGCVMWFCWTVYTFYHKPSNTIWWKKGCKILAYIVLTVIIMGFNFHELRDAWMYLIALIIVVLLLFVSRVKSAMAISDAISLGAFMPFKEVVPTIGASSSKESTECANQSENIQQKERT